MKRVKIFATETTQEVSEEAKLELKKADLMDSKGRIKLTGVSSKMLKRMRQEYVDCPVLHTTVPFIACFVCPNFQKREMGNVICKGVELIIE